MLDSIAKETDCDHIFIDEDTEVPDYPGKIVVI
jgi:hypothetical protein